MALFAALSYAVTSSSRTGSGGANKDKSKLVASQIVQYATRIEQAITRLKVLNVCSDTQISFERSPFDGSDTAYINPNAPADKSCHVFHQDGGAVANEIFPPETFTGTNWETTYSFYAANPLSGVGSDLPELALYAPVTLETCQALNKIYGYTSIPSTGWSGSVFVGTYTTSSTIEFGTARSYCFVYSANNRHYYRHTLIAR